MEVREWQQRCIGFERDCAASAMRVDAAAMEYQASQRCERSLEAAVLQQRLSEVEVKNAEAEAWVQARVLTGDTQKLERSLATSMSEVEVLRAELQEAQAQGFRAQGSLSRLEREHKILKEDRDEQHLALASAMERLGALASRCEGLEALATTAECAGASALRENH